MAKENQGQKYDPKVKEEIRGRLALGESITAISNNTKVSRTAIYAWKREWDKEEPDPLHDELLSQKKAEFIKQCWSNIELCNTLIERRLRRAAENEEQLNKILDELLSQEGMTDTRRKALLSQFASLKMENPRDTAVILGTIYDKQALANKEPTEIVDGEVKVTKFEDL